MENLSLLTDLYQLTMIAGYHYCDKQDERSCFDLYFRRNPFKGGYCIAAGQEMALQYLESLCFGNDELDYLRSLSLFSPSFLKWLSRFRFEGTVWGLQEGEPVFPNQPILRVEAPLAQAQLVESALLNLVNFQTLVATKASRVKSAADNDLVLEFGLRRAQGVDGAMAASRASYIGGCEATSNTLAGMTYQIPVKGTHAHSWIMSFPTELEAFRAYARTYPDSCTLLVDTYDTLKSGLPNAVIVGKELAERGHRLAGVRLDSGDMAQLSIEARRMLDEAGLTEARIVASNDLDEHEILRLKERGAAIDIWGVGTNLVTCKDEPALGGVYKLVASGPELTPRIKVSSNAVKTTFPDRKQIYRFYDAEGRMVGDQLVRAGEPEPEADRSHRSFSTIDTERRELVGGSIRALLSPLMTRGRRTAPPEALAQKRERAQRELRTLPESVRRLTSPERYWVGMSEELQRLRTEMIAQCLS